MLQKSLIWRILMGTVVTNTIMILMRSQKILTVHKSTMYAVTWYWRLSLPARSVLLGTPALMVIVMMVIVFHNHKVSCWLSQVLCGHFVFTVYGYSVLSAVIISVLSQLGVITVLFSYNNHKAKYIISLLIAVGVSTLVSDAILHLIPQVCSK